MTLLEEIDQTWKEANAEQLSTKWVSQLVDSKDRVENAVQLFREWSPLHVYLPVTRAIDPRSSFSLRYQGQEVASLSVRDEQVQIHIDRVRSKTNAKYFDIDMEGKFDWRGPQAAEFRKRFKNVSFDLKGRIPEHRIEAEFLHEMSNITSSKFNGTLRNIQPVMFAGCPFQFPLPISGSTGRPKPTKGNIDILARRGIGGGTKLSVWELKRPGITAHAIEQSYIYAATLLKMLRSDSGSLWYSDVMGFSRTLPIKLTIESVVAVSLSERERVKLQSRLSDFIKDNDLQIGDDKISMHLAFYEENPLRVVDIIDVN